MTFLNKTALIWTLLLITSNDVLSVKNKVRHFPLNMMFGAATSAYQVEGGWNADGKGRSIWDDLTHKEPSVIGDESNGDVAADSYNLYKKDVALAVDLGLDFYRFSLSWPRILPTGFTDVLNQAGIQYYNKLIDELLRNNIRPMATMYHWDLPSNLQKMGGFANPYIVEAFEGYAKILFEKYGDRVKHWITINEPKQICYEGYGSDKKAPRVNMTGVAEYLCAKNVLLAHAKVYHMYNEKFKRLQDGVVGISVSCTWFEPASDQFDDHQAAEDASQFDWGQYIHPIYSKNGDFPLELKKNIGTKSAEQGFGSSRLPEFSSSEINLIKGASDFLGVNSYTSKLAYRDPSVEGIYAVPSYMDDMGVVLVKDQTWPQAESPWLQEVPWGFLKLLNQIRVIYDNPPVYITENGWSTAGGLLDDDRVKYLRNYLYALLDAVDAGSDIRAYTAWSLIDNFEWMSGFREKFGLYEVDFESPDKPRIARKSAYVYKEIVKTRTLDFDYEPEIILIQRNITEKPLMDDEDGY